MNDVRVEPRQVRAEDFQDRNDKHPLVYADQVMSIAFGPFVTRMTLGVEGHTEPSRTPVITIAMPTNAAHQILAELAKQLGSPDVRRQFEDTYKNYVDSELFARGE